jgi:putative nucleotidyltransferase with HDIG domain
MSIISSLKDLVQRSQLFRSAVLTFITYFVVYVGYCLFLDGDFKRIDLNYILYFGISSFLLLFAYGLIYIFERIFGFLSNVTLIELSNVNSPLLLRLSEVAPGTFQHSLQVANLVTEAGKRINANTLLLRVGAMYHDIGKVENPLYFTENQLNELNPLSDLDYEVAAQHIIKHVEEGVRIAEKNGLPIRVIEFIKTHHGKSRTRYFYNSFINKFPDRKVNEEAFMYLGPSPKTKEQALLMMADAVEASSRSLTEYSDETINLLVDTILDKQIADGLLKDARITFVDVETVKEVFKEKLKTIYHTRVSYPELTKNKIL